MHFPAVFSTIQRNRCIKIHFRRMFRHTMTIYDIARAANVSPSTVSRVLNGKTGVKKEKRDQILQLLQENNFNLKRAKQAVPTKCSRVIGVLVPDLHDPTYMEGAYALTCFLDKAGFSVIVMNGGDSDRQRADTVACLAKRHVEGAVLVGSKFGSPEVSESLRDHLGEVPVLTVNASFTLPNVYSVVADEANGVRQCVGYLYRRGRRKLLLLLDKDCPSSDKKESGFQAGCAEYPDISGHICRNVIATTENAAQAIRLAIAEAPDCDAILCSGDMLAAYVERHMQNLGYQVPGQISLIGMGNTCFSEVSNPRISSLNTRMVDGCLQAGQLLVRLLEGEQVERSTTLTCDLIIREST